MVLLGSQKMEKPIIRRMRYDADTLNEEEFESLRKAAEGINNNEVTWINIFGLHDMELMKQIGDQFKLPSLLIENVLNTDQRPKYEVGDDYEAFILKMIHFDRDSNELVAEQITIVLGDNYVLSLQEREGDVFNPVRERIRKVKGKVRLQHNDYLIYALLDIIIDNYAILIENIGRKVEDLEDHIFQSKDIKTVEEIYQYKVELNYMRKAIRPVKEMMTHILKSEETHFHENTKKYLNDLNDNIISSTDALELYNNLISDQLNIYNASAGNRMNEVMKVLTIFASIFIPLSFLAGVFGMNFEFMPELKIKIAYPIFWVVVVMVIGGLLIYFKRKKWL